MKGKNKFLAAAVFSLLSFGVVAGESYTCALDAKKTKGWIPSTIKISFNDDNQLTRLYSADYAYDYDLEIVKVLRYTKDFREVKYISQHQTAEAGTKYRAIHIITILPKLNNKISYMLKFLAYSNHYNARGTCKKTELNQTKNALNQTKNALNQTKNAPDVDGINPALTFGLKNEGWLVRLYEKYQSIGGYKAFAIASPSVKYIAAAGWAGDKTNSKYARERALKFCEDNNESDTPCKVIEEGNIE